ncbi:S41 family peptidase [Aliiglaciecola lipolytica]|uniref:S41 family peptidase n=1 Tax=Aliiglaciecola lipolytica TaxID=477689 RepID=UPI001C087A37|nr:S41 family peptidase [Aliiglaciecola lipolytica]MBU2877055.1 S41 family peptidase [Aliiglaciecola lipolytica]
MKLIKQLSIITAAITLAACGSSNTDKTVGLNDIDQDYQGIWISEDKGLAVDVGIDRVVNYKFTSDYCFKVDELDNVTTNDITRVVNLTDDGTLDWFAGYGPQNMRASSFELFKMSNLPLSCQTNLVPLLGQAGHTRNPEQTFAIFSQIFEEYYMDFELQNVDWLGLAQAQAAAINADSSDLDLLIAMDNMIQPLADAHTSVSTPDGITVSYNNKLVLAERLVKEFAEANGMPFPIPAQIITETQLQQLQVYVEQGLATQQAIIANYAVDEDAIKERADGAVFWFENEGIGYLHIGKMLGFHEDNDEADTLQNDTDEIAAIDAILDEALSDLANVEGLIVDVRTNNGGHEFVSLAIASRFADSRVLAYTKKHGKTSPTQEIFIEPRGEHTFTGPIALLVSATTVSAAETFAMSMSVLDNVTLIGETTQGAFSDIMDWTLPNGFDIALSSEFYYDVDGNWLEGEGVPVDIEVPFFSQQEREEGYDAGIEAAISLFDQ